MRLAIRFILGTLAALALHGAFAEEPDWSGYGALLERHLSRRSAAGIDLAWLDYAALKEDPRFARILVQLASFDAERLESGAERLAFYINAYNILAVKTVLDHWPVSSIKDAGSLLRPVWKRPAGTIGGQTFSLDDIEHGVLRKLGEPRVHLAIVCASKSCPDLQREPYTAAKLDTQLDAASAQFLNNRSKGLRVEAGGLRVSKIFDWFGEDFEAGGGVETLIRGYVAGLPAGLPVRADLPYDWSLNGE